ncbi:hypothetical protein [Parendozoicomonas haliclonae]|uniref:Uncharacterized protein n=1 Tax=Parendozoicomonas haliclonae TaxID=1960125 RepID=A0A1X7AE18_9GAMM|nr:hypothetical protein [Parendozoicomonas haliclonae]SMA33232.1 hypothetical protein EHSB41UT_00243 [Parendozoicomonas haliclonae]
MSRLQTYKDDYAEYNKASTEYAQSSFELMKELEKLLPEDHPVRVRRAELRQIMATAKAPGDVTPQAVPVAL